MEKMALPPHWLDEVLQNVRDSDELLPLLLNAPEMQKIAAEASAAGEKQRQLIDGNPKYVGPNPAQVMRQEFLRRLNTSSREEALAHAH
jgi:hypothetical protein